MVSDHALRGEAPRGQRHDDFDDRIGEALRLGWMGHYSVAHTMLAALLAREPSTVGERALCRALLALVSAALDDLSAARRFARQAIHDSARPNPKTPAAEARKRRLARAVGVNACTLVGDTVRAGRAAQARFVAGDADARWLMNLGLVPPWGDAPPPIQRYAKFVAAVHAVFAQRPQPGPLTPSEVGILKLVAAGHSSVAAAALVGRSTQTVRTHLRNAYAKLGAHGRGDAIDRARGLGLLD